MSISVSCVNARAQIHICQSAYVWVRGQPQVSVLGSHFVLEETSLLSTTAHCRLAGPQWAGTRLCVPAILLQEHCDYKPQLPLWLHVGSRHLIPGPHACAPTVLSTGPSPSLHVLFLKLSKIREKDYKFKANLSYLVTCWCRREWAP